MFDRDVCRVLEKEVIACEHREGLYMSSQQIVRRLEEGLQQDRKRKQAINSKLVANF
jgi:hypothetical protein